MSFNILIVNDEVNIRKTLSVCLETEGHKVIAVSNFQDALAEASRRSLPEMNEELLVLVRKLKASPNDFMGQQIKLHCRFGGFENKFLDETSGPKFLSTYYIGLIVQSGKEINEPILTHLFINKKEAKKQGVYYLGVNDLITVYGIVNSAYNKEPWIEVYVVKKGWE